ncbi:hypothetical protein B0H34DRAFT_663338 [Crassisporium funariophilum]|nr:hypothetical protein B0H34DRAFT_663338 [Crassisporium funariophilum]
MYRKISRDVNVAAIQLYERGLLALDDILDCCGLSRRTFYRILKLWRHTGNVIAPRTNPRGQPRMLDHDNLQHLLELVRENPDYFLDELLRLLETNCFISLHYATIHRELKRARISLKKLKIIALERDKERRASFISRMAQYAPEEIGFLDELSKDARAVSRRHGMVSGTVVEGSLTKKRFLEYIEYTVVSHYLSSCLCRLFH